MKNDSRIQAWLMAARLRTLPLALSSIAMAGFLAAYFEVFNWPVFLLCICTTICLQVLSNFANDYGDAKHGVDSLDREGPARAVQSGLLSSVQMKKGMYLFAGLSLLSGIILLYIAFGLNWQLFFIFFGLGLLAILAAIAYTASKNPYGYIGLGDISVFIFFGLVGVIGAYFLFSASFSIALLFPAISCGFFSTAVLNINNIRDIGSDAAAGKKSIPVRIGRASAVYYHWLLLLGGWLAAMHFTFWYTDGISPWIYLVTLPLFLRNALAVKQKETAAALDPFLKQMAIATLFFVLAFGFGLLV